MRWRRWRWWPNAARATWCGAIRRAARCCYGHLAGQLGVRLFDTLLEREGLRATADGYALTDVGHAWLASLGLAAPAPGTRRRFAYACMDWSERRDHLAGQLATALFQHFLARGWLRRNGARAVETTPLGARELLPRLGGAAPACRRNFSADAPAAAPRRP